MYKSLYFFFLDVSFFDVFCTCSAAALVVVVSCGFIVALGSVPVDDDDDVKVWVSGLWTTVVDVCAASVGFLLNSFKKVFFVTLRNFPASLALLGLINLLNPPI
jgi:hypothetical protein